MTFGARTRRALPSLTELGAKLIYEADAREVAAARVVMEAATGALVCAYGANCFARFELSIPPEHCFMRGAPNPFVHTPEWP